MSELQSAGDPGCALFFLTVLALSLAKVRAQTRKQEKIQGPRAGCMLGNISLEHRIIESLRLEKTSKIIKSDRQRLTIMPGKPCPEVQCSVHATSC